MPFWGSLSFGVSLGTLSHCGHYGMHLPLGIPCVAVKGSMSGRGVCMGFLSILCHEFPVSPQRFFSSLGCFSVMGLVSLGFCVFEGPCPITEFPRIKGSYVTSGTSVGILVLCGDPVPLWVISVTVMWVSVYNQGFCHWGFLCSGGMLCLDRLLSLWGSLSSLGSYPCGCLRKK